MRDGDNLIITGFMGTGKTSVGQEIARRLGREFVDMDTLIEAREDMTVADIFARRGKAHFRRLEATLCRELAARPGLRPEPAEGLVIATGGGALIPAANREILSASGPVFCLTTSPDEILRRLEASEDRPLLDVPDRRARIAALLAERSEAYRRIPLQVDTTDLTVAQVADRVMAVADTLPATAIPVRYPDGEYAIHLGRGLLTQSGTLLRQRGLSGQVALVTNPTVDDLYTALVAESLETAGFQVATCTVPDGEAHKTLDMVRTLYDCFIEAGLDRRGAVLALGGGVIGDMAGFAAATYLRGVPLVQLPTTLLAMVDASVGGKVAVDHPRGKNLIGAFKQPTLVVTDPDVLVTLPEKEMDNGLAEVTKAGIIGDPALFEQIEAHGPAPLPWLIEQAVRVKVAVVEDDPYERGRRATLNLGHTFGHALELLSGYALPHGEGVSVGLTAATRLSARMGLCDPALATRVEGVLARLGLPTTYRGHTPAHVWQAMATDKKRRGKTLRFVLPRAVSDVFVTDQVTQADVLAVLETLRET
ncbi:MAG: 3-dehydroquinate synthase [Anaerolineales bacterium]|nr:MAG: 3-dehydroquinate synthase [Anaerolineales bacterium]